MRPACEPSTVEARQLTVDAIWQGQCIVAGECRPVGQTIALANALIGGVSFVKR